MGRFSSIPTIIPTDDRLLESISLHTVDQLSYDPEALEGV